MTACHFQISALICLHIHFLRQQSHFVDNQINRMEGGLACTNVNCQFRMSGALNVFANKQLNPKISKKNFSVKKKRSRSPEQLKQKSNHSVNLLF